MRVGRSGVLEARGGNHAREGAGEGRRRREAEEGEEGNGNGE